MNPELSNLPVARRSRRAVRWTSALVLAATIAVAACEGSLTVPGQNAIWGFVTIIAAKSNAGEYRAAPLGQFFKGTLSSVPNAQIVFDSCVPGLSYSEPSEVVGGVNFLDAGPLVELQIGTRKDTLPRVTSASNTLYQKGVTSPVSFTPGDSIVVTIPGAVGGYPASEIRGKTAEPFTNDPVTPPAGNETIQFRWSAASDFNSAMIISMRYARAQDNGRLTQQVLCAFTDDGVDSVPFRNHRSWSDASNTNREIVFTRLRTSIKSQNEGVLEIISRFQTPVPTLN